MIHQHFIGRHRELAALDQAYRQRSGQFFPIYGRRRVGKSELILRFIQSKSAVYFLGKKASAREEIREFLQTAAKSLNRPILASLSPDRWKTAIEAVVEESHSSGRLILVFDEFQWTVEKSPDLPFVLQELWDTKWQKESSVFLIVCGSYIGFMEKEVLGRKSPLFGRRTGQILLKPFGYQEAARFHPNYSFADKAMTYFICGGIPLYLGLFSPKRSVIQNIQEALLNEFSPLFQEPEFLLREELREVEKYYAILMALATGSLPSRQITEQTGVPDRHLPYYLNHLIELGYVSRRYPITGRPAPPQKVRFTLSDPLLRFWFRFIYPQRSWVSRLGPERFMSELIRKNLDAYFGTCFETLCREALPALYEKENVPTSFEVGEYWDKHVQIDLVSFRKDGWIDLGECKWSSGRSASALEAELRQKMAHYPNPTGATLGGRIFVRRKIRRPPASTVSWFTLEDLYEV